MAAAARITDLSEQEIRWLRKYRARAWQLIEQFQQKVRALETTQLGGLRVSVLLDPDITNDVMRSIVMNEAYPVKLV